MTTAYDFAPEIYEEQLAALIDEIDRLDRFDSDLVDPILRKYPKDGRGFFSKSDIIHGFRYLSSRRSWRHSEESFLEKLRKKPVRTLSGVAPVTVLTKPYPCPGRCIFCPSDVRMPKSYLSDEPGAQRAAHYQFDPYWQSLSRLQTYHNNGHPVDKVELIILGGTWSSYSEEYQIWFVKRCFDAMNDFDQERVNGFASEPEAPSIDFRTLEARVHGQRLRRSYNQIVSDYAGPQAAGGLDNEAATWAELARVHRANETAAARCVGLVLETRPDSLDHEEVLRLRRLGTTKVQIGYQSLSDEVLQLNRRGHDVAATRRAMRLLRAAAFKIHAHWMPNLYGSTPEADIEDFDRIFSDADFRPDELKIYPCSLIESAELMAYYRRGDWRPYTHEELLDVIVRCLHRTPEYCRLTRVIRDIPGTDIVVGNKITNLRQVAEDELRNRGWSSRDIRSREVRDRRVSRDELEIRETRYSTSIGTEIFIQFLMPDDQLASFLRLSLPSEKAAIDEIADSALIREVHVYGRLLGIGRHQTGRSQHLGLGRELVERAMSISRSARFKDLAVISSVGTREYYRKLGFTHGPLYQHFDLG